MDYLRWYRRVLGLDVRNEHRVLAVLPRRRRSGSISNPRRPPRGAGAPRSAGHGPRRPGRRRARFAHKIPRARWAHSSDVMDYAMLAGKRVGVVGAGASAMDSAATALEAGAASVDLLIRRDDIPRINKGKGAGNPGLTHGHLNLPDDWKIRHYINAAQVPPPPQAPARVAPPNAPAWAAACGTRWSTTRSASPRPKASSRWTS